jgi:hypothetical protein
MQGSGLGHWSYRQERHTVAVERECATVPTLCEAAHGLADLILVSLSQEARRS